MTQLGSTGGKIRKAYVDSPIGQLHLRYAAPDGSSHRPVVFFTAAPSSGELYNEMIEEMGRDRLAIAFDNPGAGESAWPAQPFDHPSQLAELYSGVLARLGIGTVDAFGHHSGATLALSFAAFNPGQAGRLVVTGVPYVADAEQRAALRSRWASFETQERLQTYLKRNYDYYFEQVARVGFARTVELYVDSLSPDVKMNWLYLVSYADGAEAWMGKVQAPVLYLQIEDMLTEASAQAARLTPRSVIRDRPDLDHFALFNQADEMGRELRAFFDAG